jgi:hypothetical protein
MKTILLSFSQAKAGASISLGTKVSSLRALVRILGISA